MLAVVAPGCFTGIESTPRIRGTELKSGRRAPRPEAGYLDGIAPEPPSQWRRGKKWTVTDARSQRVFGRDLAGAELTLAGISEATSIMGFPEAVVTFDSPYGQVAYRTGFSADSLMRRSSLPIPYAVENSLVDAVSRRLKGNTYYVTTSLWNDFEGKSLRGLRYIKAEVTDVVPGAGVYPIRLYMSYQVPVKGVAATPGIARGDDDRRRYFALSLAAPGSDDDATTRSFADLLSLSDPRDRYPRIEDKAWANIMAGRVGEGMTREECRLALGTPDEVRRNAGYSELYETWLYAEGIRLVFTDGILTSAYR